MRWDEDEAERFLGVLAGMGVNTVCTESETYRDDLIALSHQMGLKWIGGISCFSDHGHSNKLLQDRPELWPIGEDGEPRPQMEWYLGVTPTFEDVNAERLRLAEQIVRAYELDGFMLDFVRWPVHWELEIRPGAAPIQQYSFDPHTLTIFQSETGISLPVSLSSAKERARWILDRHYDQWVDFKCRVITRFVEQCAARLRAIRPRSFPLGAYLLPMPPNELSAIAGQSISALAPILDMLAPMAYHAIVHRSVDWVREVVDWFIKLAPGKVLPVLQVDSAEGAEMGADWGPPMPEEEWETLVKNILPLDQINGVVAFTGTSLFRDQRGKILRENL